MTVFWILLLLGLLAVHTVVVSVLTHKIIVSIQETIQADKIRAEYMDNDGTRVLAYRDALFIETDKSVHVYERKWD